MILTKSKAALSAATLSISSIFSPLAFGQEKPAETPNTPITVSGNITYVYEVLNSGNIQINPLPIGNLTVRKGDIAANFAVDLIGPANDPSGVEIEKAMLTYFGETWSFSAGLIGQEPSKFIPLTSPGKRPDGHARQRTFFAIGKDRSDSLGIQAKMNDFYGWNVEVTAFAGLDPDESTQGLQRRGNSGDVSWNIRAFRKDKIGNTTLGTGIEFLRNKSDSGNGRPETVTSVFAYVAQPLTQRLTWNASTNFIHSDNFLQTGENRNIAGFYTDLTYAFDNKISIWAQPSLILDSNASNLGIFEIGARLPIFETEKGSKLFLTLSGDVEYQLEQATFSEQNRTNWGAQTALRYEF